MLTCKRDIKRVVEPADEPLTIPEVRMHLRNPERTSNDAELLAFIRAGREAAEHRLQRALLTQTWEMKLDSFEAFSFSLTSSGTYPYVGLELPWPPLQSVESIKYLDANNALQTLATTEYVVDTSGDVGRVHLAYSKSWPTVLSGYVNPITIRWVAGYTSPDLIPQSIREWIKLYVEYRDKNRGLTTEREQFPAMFAERLIDEWRQPGV